MFTLVIGTSPATHTPPQPQANRFLPQPENSRGEGGGEPEREREREDTSRVGVHAGQMFTESEEYAGASISVHNHHFRGTTTTRENWMS